ncbi:C-Myc-binding protein homolog isoform X1 [Brassica rapa]|uniref:C-Myc-binding protein homolog isoform X1 n=1 Tax=Brassica campestris TaxID=3711 RepID=UPI0004F16042|nr:C-Myc-binding protein homolog isoform X1 [Brassica rapa]XP_033141969.1 C-Myc-binding protein homolog isoform X1 [Brassica rapa]
MMRFKEEKEAKKEAFRKYLESSGVLDSLTKVLVALYEQNDKPSSALEFIQQKLGGPSVSDYEKLQAEKSDLQIKYNELFAKHQETLREVSLPNLNLKLEGVKSLHSRNSSKDDDEREVIEDEHTALVAPPHH